MTEIIEVPIDLIDPPLMNRDVSDEGIEELQRSIASRGIIEPLIVAKSDDRFILVAGSRRLTAARNLVLPTVPCIVYEGDSEDILAISVHENLFRENLSPIDEAQFYAYFRDSLYFSEKKISQMVAKSPPYISQRLSILKWHPELIEALRSDRISFSVARELSQITDVDQLVFLVRSAIETGANYRTARAWVSEWKKSIAPQPEVETEADGRERPPPLEPPSFPCFGCGANHLIEELHIIRLCRECYDDIDKARRESG